MALQADPTIQYASARPWPARTAAVQSRLCLSVTLQHLSHPGLPPTPIGNPVTRAIEAVLLPCQGRELYFVARGDGAIVRGDVRAAPQNIRAVRN